MQSHTQLHLRVLGFVVAVLTILFMPLAVVAAAPQIAAGRFHSVVLKADGSLWSWGSNYFGQLGDGGNTDAVMPKQIGVGFSQVAAGSGHTVALKPDGSLWAWGYNGDGQLGDGTRLSTSAPILIGTGFSQVAAGYSHTLALKSDGGLWAWGDNSDGKLGDGATTRSLVPKQIGAGFRQIAASFAHSAALKADGSLWMWGSNRHGQLGDGTTTAALTPKLIATGFSQVALGWDHTAAIKADGTLWAWGSNGEGRLGDGSFVDSTVPKQIGTGFIQVTAGEKHTAAVKADGGLWVWGFQGTIGDGNRPEQSNISSPKQIGSGVGQVAAGSRHTVAMKTDGSLWAWGENSSGQLGDGAPDYLSSPVAIGTGFSEIAAGYFHTAALKADGTLWTWGYNGDGQLGDGTTDISLVPKQIGVGFAQIAAGAFHTTALKADGGLWTWGYNGYGQLGDGSAASSWVPKYVGAGYSRISAGRGHTVALKPDMTLWAWGLNEFGQLGDGSTTNVVTPKQIGTDYRRIAAGRDHTAAVKNDGSLWVWGDNRSRQLINGAGNDFDLVRSAVQVGTGFSEVAAGGAHNLAIKTDESLWAWGSDGFGQISGGRWPFGSTSVPTNIGQGFSQVAAGGNDSAALTPDGSLWTWGENRFGQVRGGSGSWSAIGTRFKRIALGRYHLVALKADGSLWAWGYNDYGQLGAGVPTWVPHLVKDAAGNGRFNLLDANPAVVPLRLTISAPSTLYSNASAQLTATATFSDSRNENVSPQWSIFPVVPLTVSSSGVLTAGKIDADLPVRVIASYTSAGVTVAATKTLTLVPAPLSSLTLSGGSRVAAGCLLRFSARATYADGSSRGVTPTWSVSPASAGSFNSRGEFTAANLGTDTQAIVGASYTDNGVTQTATLALTVKTTPSTLSSLAIVGTRGALTAGESFQLAAEAGYADGSGKRVSVAWSGSGPVSIDGNGRLTANPVMSDTPYSVSATYRDAGRTLTARYSGVVQAGVEAQMFSTEIIASQYADNLSRLRLWFNSNANVEAAAPSGKRYQVFVVARVPSGALYELNRSGEWREVVMWPNPASEVNDGEWVLMDLFDRLDTSLLAGTLIFVGYGESVTQMLLDKRYQVRYRMP